MNSDYWNRVWELCEQARQVSQQEQAEFVHLHASDARMASEVLSLLEQPNNSVVDSWASGDAPSVGGGSAVRAAPILTGRQIGRYTIGERIGQGAAGDVYSAQDSQLERPVAIKFLRSSSRQSPWRIESVLREARAASGLNHPGIVTVHEVIQSEAGLAIVMELVDGQSLRPYCNSPNPIADVVRWVSHVANALATAHRNNIIHRDIKPENIMLRGDGLTKVLDFGLAQSIAEDQQSPSFVGTLRYMSPEQAAGEPLTAATDVFSLGIVLYELTAGRHPFPASNFESFLPLLDACQPEPLSRLRPDVPKALEILILDMLRKAPEARPSADEAGKRLAGIVQPVKPARGRIWLSAGLAAAGIVAAALWMTRKDPEPPAPAPLAASPLTNTPGFDSWPDISPDGKEVAYGWGISPDSYTHIYIKNFDHDTPVKLVEAEHGYRIGRPKWSSDGKRIYFKQTTTRPGQEAINSISWNGGESRREVQLLSNDLSSGIDVSPDGKRLVYGDRPASNLEFCLYLKDFGSGQTTQLTTGGEGYWGDWDPHFSPDGKEIAFKRVSEIADDRIYIIPTAGGVARLLSIPRQSIYGHAWLPDGQLLLATQLGSVIHALWQVPLEQNRKPTQVYASGVDATMPAVRGNRIVWVNRIRDYNIYSVPVAGGKPTKRIASPVLDSIPAIAPDGRVVFVSHRSGSPELWLAAPDGSSANRITDLRSVLGRPAWSPDGTRLVFSGRRVDVTRLYIVRCPPGSLQCDAPEPAGEGDRPAWTADGKGLYISPGREAKIWKVALSGGDRTFVANGEASVVSPDGKWLYYSRSDGRGRVFRTPLNADGTPAGGAEEPVVPRQPNSAGLDHWALAGSEILYWESNIESKSSRLLALNLATKRTRTVVATTAAEYPAVSPDGKTVWYAQPDAAGGTLMTAERDR